MRTVKSSYGSPAFNPAEHVVKALHAEVRRGQVSHPCGSEKEAVEMAHRLKQEGAYSDVLILTRDSRGAFIQVFQGVEWFCQEELNAAHPGWRFHDEAPGPDVVGIPTPLPATLSVSTWRKVLDENGEEDWIQELVETPLPAMRDEELVPDASEAA